VYKGGDSENLDTTGARDFFFGHVFLENGMANSEFLSILQPVVDKLDIEELLRIKGNLSTKTIAVSADGWHCDMQTDNKPLNSTTAILYLNDCDGYTEIIDEKGTTHTINSKANRFVTFPNSFLHSGFSQTNTKVRVLINFNYYERKK
jgi:hypothetical protein